MSTHKSDHKRQTFETDLGTKAKVHREDVASQCAAIGNAMLREIGKNLNTISESEYLGSCAVHIYKPKGQIQYLHFASQVMPMQNVPEVVADKALTELKGKLMEFFGHNRAKKLSGL